jgi:hypothetical protein
VLDVARLAGDDQVGARLVEGGDELVDVATDPATVLRNRRRVDEDPWADGGVHGTTLHSEAPPPYGEL